MDMLTSAFIEKIHNEKYSYNKTIYKNAKTKVIITCSEHGDFSKLPNDHYRSGCPKCSKIEANKKLKSTQEAFFLKAKRKFGNKYNYSNVVYNKWDEKVEIICPEHGSFYQTPNNHLHPSTSIGCPECANNTKKDTNHFINRSIVTHGNRYNYSKAVYIDVKTSVEIICPSHGSFYQTPPNHYRFGCPKCNSSKGEIKIRNLLNNLGIVFQEQYNFNKHLGLKVGKCSYLKFDFYLPSHNMCIEYDGIQHFEEVKHFKLSLKQIQYNDLQKNLFCLNNNIRLFRIKYNDDINKLIRDLI